MEEKKNFVKDSKIALSGSLLGIIGSSIIQIIITYVFTFLLTFIVASKLGSQDISQVENSVLDITSSMQYLAIILLVSNIITFIMFCVILKKDVIKNYFKGFNKEALIKGVITAFIIMGVSIVYNLIILNLFNLDGNGNANQESVIGLVSETPLLAFLSIVVLGPIIEEFTYRYCLFGGLYEKNKKLAYLVSATIFMAMHFVSSLTEAGGFNMAFVNELIYLPPYLFSGLALCYIYDKTDNLASSSVAHIVNNLVSFLSIVLAYCIM